MPNFHYAYVLRIQKDNGFYVGSTPDLKSRLAKHKDGKVFSTKPRIPFDLIFYKAYRNENDASRREVYLKSTNGRTTLKTMFKDFLRESESKLQQSYCSLSTASLVLVTLAVRLRLRLFSLFTMWLSILELDN